ncbi:hydrogenase maturation nickel metallochaperone HypA (plasmid) [Streptomyces sp. NBC_01650]|uniref:hypothetical protein n=1 Tax=Streptomyces sp. NBC_01650 TaxID=2975907 RepID=UPI003862FF23|nr:hydrogenase maturation nickel metallochaperone HypA [Streptomyces sp. NBC_01650]
MASTPRIRHIRSSARTARRSARWLGVLASAWQCMSCAAWFESDVPSQLCPSCGG